VIIILGRSSKEKYYVDRQCMPPIILKSVKPGKKHHVGYNIGA
jgi:hypothetical protein